ncbi:MAG: nuclear transport factor 2 family protein [Sediminibacterium sp.]|nr:nuclear transport factor 2 family protein [Sediminibacterium sp.]
MKLFATALCFFLTVTAALSQTTPEDSIKIAIGKFFTSIRNSDGMSFRQSFADSSTYINVNRDKFGEPVPRAAGIMDVALLISSVPRGSVDPRISFDMVKVNGSLASAWVPYKFYAGGQQLYCAVASIQMIRIKGNWKILYYIDRKVNCQ